MAAVGDAGRVVVGAPPDLAERLDSLGHDWLEPVPWDGLSEPPRDDIVLWVVPYAVDRSAESAQSALAALPDVAVVQLLSAGVEPWAGLVPEGVQLCNGRGIHGGSTAELAVALTLSLVRDLPRYLDQQQGAEWQRHEPDTVADRRVVVLGAGDIGERVAATFRTLGADVVVAARRERDGVVALHAVHALLPDTDVLVVALPLTEETRGLVDERMLAALPDEAIVVNVARGPVLDLEALTDHVARGRLRAGLDVTDPEPLPADHPLWSLNGVVITPHVGGGASGWFDRAVRLVTDQVERLHDGRDLRNVVSEGY